VVGSCEYSDEPSGSGAMEVVSAISELSHNISTDETEELVLILNQFFKEWCTSSVSHMEHY
jgi:hypothetical protein